MAETSFALRSPLPAFSNKLQNTRETVLKLLILLNTKAHYSLEHYYNKKNEDLSRWRRTGRAMEERTLPRKLTRQLYWMVDRCVARVIVPLLAAPCISNRLDSASVRAHPLAFPQCFLFPPYLTGAPSHNAAISFQDCSLKLSGTEPMTSQMNQ